MSRVSRSRFTASFATAFATAAVRFPAGAAEFSYKFGHAQPTIHPVHVRAVEAADKILKESGGRLEVKIYPNSQLGGQNQVVSQLRLGALEFLCIGDGTVATIVPAANLASIPFSFAGSADMWRGLDGPLGASVRLQITKVSGLYVLDKGWDVGFRQMFNSIRPLNVPEDAKGLKLRVAEAPITVALCKALGATATPTNYSEAYTSLQTHLVDGGELPLSNIASGKFYEVSKYVSMTNHMGTSCEMLANAEAWNKLPKNLRDIAERNLNAGALLSRSDIARGDDGFTTELKKQGMIFNSPDVRAFRAVLRRAGLYADWKNNFGSDAFGLLEKSVGGLT